MAYTLQSDLFHTFDVVLDGVLLEVIEELVLDETGRRHHHRLHHLEVK